jgi:hypothetical protein
MSICPKCGKKVYPMGTAKKKIVSVIIVLFILNSAERQPGTGDGKEWHTRVGDCTCCERNSRLRSRVPRLLIVLQCWQAFKSDIKNQQLNSTRLA